MPHILSRIPLAAAAALLVIATPAFAAWYIKFDGVDGEASDKKHKEWIVIASLRLASETAATGGVRVASGDVDGDGRADTAPARPGRGVISSGRDPVPAGLLLPAVQKARVATAAVPAWRGCKVGQRLPRLPIRNDKTGRTGAILDATVTDCGAEQVSFNFTKIEMR